MTKQTPPDRIYGWLNTQMSVARHFGGLVYQGEDYIIDATDPEQPLVRQSVWAAELVAAKKALAILRKEEKAKQASFI